MSDEGAQLADLVRGGGLLGRDLEVVEVGRKHGALRVPADSRIASPCAWLAHPSDHGAAARPSSAGYPARQPGPEKCSLPLASPRLFGERDEVQQMLTGQPANRPRQGTLIVASKGFAGADFEEFLAGPDLDLTLVRPARNDEKDHGIFPNWLRQRVEAIIWTLQHQLGLEHHGGRVPAGLWARIVQRLLALDAVIWHNWQIGAPVKRSLIAYDH
jgi:hypothetical protein